MPCIAAGVPHHPMTYSRCRRGGTAMLRRSIFFLLLAISVTGFGQTSSQPPDNKEILSKAKTFYVESHTFFMKREQLESSLLGHPEFKAWNLQIVNRKDLADLLVRVRRIPLTAIF